MSKSYAAVCAEKEMQESLCGMIPSSELQTDTISLQSENISISPHEILFVFFLHSVITFSNQLFL